MKIELEVKETLDIEEGKHTGEIVDVQQRKVESKDGKETFDYIDLILSIDAYDKVTLKQSVPANLSAKSKLGQLVERFGGNLDSGSKIDIVSVFKGKKVDYMTMNEDTGRGVFARVVDGSLKPKK